MGLLPHPLSVTVGNARLRDKLQIQQLLSAAHRAGKNMCLQRGKHMELQVISLWVQPCTAILSDDLQSVYHSVKK